MVVDALGIELTRVSLRLLQPLLSSLRTALAIVMLGPNKRPTRVQPAAPTNPGSNNAAPAHTLQSSNPSTPNYLRETHSFASANIASAIDPSSTRSLLPQNGQSASAAHLRGGGRKAPSTLQKCLNRMGLKSAFTLFALLVLALMIYRHHTHPRLHRIPLEEFESPAPFKEVSNGELLKDEDHTHAGVAPDHVTAIQKGEFAPDTTQLASTGPIHQHPSSFEWEHEQTPERRPPNFALNGEHPQYNEEKLTAIFERPRVAGLQTPGLVTSFFSPSGKLKLSVLMSEQGKLGYMVDVIKPDTPAGSPAVYLPLIAPSFLELNANFHSCTWNTHNAFGAEIVWQLEFGESFWRPVPGNERRHFHESYQQAKVWCVGPQCSGCSFLWELRAYDSGVAIRAVVDGHSVEGFDLQPQSDVDSEYARLDYGMEVKLIPDTQSICWAQNSEDPYVKKKCSETIEPVMTPITMVLDPAPLSELPPKTKPPVLPAKYVSILQADGPAFMRSTGQSSAESPRTMHIITKGELPVHAQEFQLGVVEHPILGWSTPTSWNVLLIADTPAELIHRNSLIYLLCPPPNPRFPMSADGRWVAHGKSLRARGHTTQKAKYLIDFAATYNYQMVHFDAGWYGDENNRTSDPKRIAPEFEKELSVKEVSEYGKEKAVGVTVYVNEIALKETLDLIDLYPKWNLAGIKFGFVDVNSPRAMRVLHQRILAYQHVGMSVNVHDIYRPRGLTRTWPHLVTQEGVRGEERKPDATHHTILPFVRYLQGAADYTPRYLKGALKCTQTHQLALPIVLFSPIQSLFWAEPGQAIVEAVQLYHPELTVWQMIPTTWDDTRVLAGEIGEYISIARRTGEDWFIGSITNTKAREITLNLTALFDNTFDNSLHPLPHMEQSIHNKKGWMIHMYEDDHSYKGDLKVEANLNNVKVKLRQEFILPALYTTQLHAITKPVAAVRQGVFPSDPVSEHLPHLANFRRACAIRQEKQLKNMFTKETGKGIPTPTVLDSPFFKIKLAPSGGNVIFLSPIP